MPCSYRLPILVVATMACAPVGAQDFHLYLKCRGEISVNDKTSEAYLDLALRDNNNTALIQRSNVLPVGERLRYMASPATYTMVYRAKAGHQLYIDTLRGTVFSSNPSLKKLAAIRLSIDRQTAELEGTLLDGEDRTLGEFAMDCTPQTTESMPAPRF